MQNWPCCRITGASGLEYIFARKCLLPSNLWRNVRCLASLLVACPFLGEVQTEVEQGMFMLTDVAHEDADLTVVNLAPVATPLPFDAYRVRTTFGKTAGIERDDAIGFAQPLDHLSN